MGASLQLPGGLKTLNPQPEITRYYNNSGTAYVNLAEVKSEVVLAARYVGQTFLIVGQEYWFMPTTADSDLVIKIAAINESNIMHLSGDEVFTGKKSSAILLSNSPAISINNPIAGAVGVQLINSNTGYALGITNSVGYGISINSASGTGVVILSTGDNGILISNGSSTGSGYNVTNNDTGNGVLVTNNVGGKGINIVNAGTGIGNFIQNNGTGIAFRIDNLLGATGKAFQYTKNNVEKAYLDDSGFLMAQKFIKAGAQATDFLMGDGSTTTNLVVSNVQTGTTYTLVNSDLGKQLIFNNAAAITVTIPTGLTVGFNCTFYQQGTGQISFSASGSTLRTSTFEVLSSQEQYSIIGMENITNMTDTYKFYGGLTSI